MALDPKLKNLMTKKAAKHREPVEPQNEYLSDQKWEELHERITQHMIPPSVCNKETTRPFYEVAMEATSSMLAGIGVLPESERKALEGSEVQEDGASSPDNLLPFFSTFAGNYPPNTTLAEMLADLGIKLPEPAKKTIPVDTGTREAEA